MSKLLSLPILLLVVGLLFISTGCSSTTSSSTHQPSTPVSNPDPFNPGIDKGKSDKGTSDKGTSDNGTSEAEKKAVEQIKSQRGQVTVDEKHPNKPVVAVFFYTGMIDEKMIGLLNDLKHLRLLSGYDLKFKPGSWKLLKNHPTLEALVLQGSTDLAVVLELPEGPALKELSFGDGKFTKDHFEAVAKLASLRTLRVSLHSAKGEVIRPLHKLKSLESLHTQGFDPLSAEDIGGFTQLKQLTCVAPTASEPFFETLAKLKNLRSLHLTAGQQGPKGAPGGLAHIGEMTDLTDLLLWFPLGDDQLIALGKLTNLEALVIYADGLTGKGFKTLRGLTKLTALQLVGFTGERDGKSTLKDEMAVDLKELKGLKSFRMHSNSLTEAGAEAIGSLSNLETLDLRSLKSNADKVMPQIVKLSKLRELDLSSSDLSDVGLKELAVLKELTTLKIGFTKTTPEGEAALRKALPKVTIIKSVTT